MNTQAKIGGALFLAVSPFAPSASATPAGAVRTEASVEIRDAAGMSVTGSAPLQLLLSTGAPSFFAVTVAPASNGVAASQSLALASSIGDIPVDDGFLPAITANGEVLSVSMTGEASNAFPGQAESGQRVRAIIAQFN